MLVCFGAESGAGASRLQSRKNLVFQGFKEESGACRLQGRIWCLKASRKNLVLEGFEEESGA